ncbi:MAG TPA: hypothetical protein DCY74_02535, partial [Clostridiales bacterium]|nr:hypothetical protein [Clostridiales bacterium]
MNGSIVHHITFGKGTIVAQKDNSIKVSFEKASLGEKNFVYPDVFARFLAFENKSQQEKMNITLQKIREKKEQK